MKYLLIAALALATLAFACGGGGGSYEAVVFGTAEGIVQRRLDTGERTVLVALPDTGHTLRDPAVSPDGSRLVYVDAPPLRRVEGALDASADLWIANSDGTEPRMLYERTRLAESFSNPQWLDDDTVMFLQRNAIEPANPQAGNEYRLLRMDVDGGAAPVTVVDGAIAFDLSDDGQRLAYIKVESAAEQPLFVATTAGGDATRRLDSAGSGLAGFSAVAFTNDGTAVWLIAHEEQSTRAWGGGRSRAMLHTAPLDLYRVPVDAGEPELIAAIQIDGGNLVLDEDGTIFLLAGDLLRLDPETGQTTTLESPDRYGGIAWRKG